jgi:hypothetical protein
MTTDRENLVARIRKAALNQDATEWLLEPSDPSAHYLALLWLRDRPHDDPEAMAAQRAVAGSEPVQRLLDAQRPQGYWERDKRPYHGVSKHLITLEHLGYRGEDERVKKAIDYLFDHAQMDDGSFTSDKQEAGRHGVIPCFTANAVHFLCWFGYGDDERTEGALDYLLRTQLDDGGWLCSERVKKTHTCFWATAKVLRALSALPQERQTPQVQEAQKQAVDLFLDKGLYHHHSEFGKVSTRWFEFARPLFASTDVLEVLELLAPQVSPDDERIQEGLEMVLAKQDSRGRWPTEREVRVRKTFPIGFDEVGQPSKSVTLHALVMLKSLLH